MIETSKIGSSLLAMICNMIQNHLYPNDLRMETIPAITENVRYREISKGATNCACRNRDVFFCRNRSELEATLNQKKSMPIASKDCNYCIHSPTTGLFESLPPRLLSEQSFKKTIYGTGSLKSIYGFHVLLCAPSPWFFTLLGWSVRSRKLHLAKTPNSRSRWWALRHKPLIVPMQSSSIKQWYLLGYR